MSQSVNLLFYLYLFLLDMEQSEVKPVEIEASDMRCENRGWSWKIHPLSRGILLFIDKMLKYSSFLVVVFWNNVN